MADPVFHAAIQGEEEEEAEESSLHVVPRFVSFGIEAKVRGPTFHICNHL